MVEEPQDPELLDEELEEEDDELEGPPTLLERMGVPGLIAAGVHALILFIMTLIVFPGIVRDKVKDYTIQAKPPEEVVEEELERDLEENLKEVPLEEQVVDPVIMKDVEQADHNETADEEDFSEAKGEPDNVSMVDFNQKSALDVMGGGGGGGGKFGNRLGGRRNLVRAYGGSKRTESAVEAALRWLKRHQHKDGTWDSDGFSDNCYAGRCSGPGRSEWDPGVSGLAMLAYTGRGETHIFGKYTDTVERGMKALIKTQDNDGVFGPKKGHYMYNHTVATLALAELYAMTDDDQLKQPVEKGIDFLVRSQNPDLVWRYQNYNVPGVVLGDQEKLYGINDTSVTTWAIMALKTAKVVGINFPDSAFKGTSNWLDQVYKGSTEYSGDGIYEYAAGSVIHDLSTTACGMLCRQFMGQTTGVAQGGNSLLKKLPNWEGQGYDGRNFYYWYYGTLAMFQLQGDYWKKWNKAMQKALIPNQHNTKKLCIDGSWDPENTSWGRYGGRVYTTAAGALCLEVFYRYMPMVRNEAGNAAVKSE